MKRIFLFFIFFSLFIGPAIAQDDLFGTEKKPPRQGWVISFNGTLDFPGGDMAERFGTSYRFGPSVFYKTKSNWIFGAKFDFISGSNVREDSLLTNIINDDGTLLNQQGIRTRFNIYQRGYMVGLQGGKIFNLSKKSSETGILVLTTAGFMQHKIKIFDRDKAISQIKGEYNKGYDRLTNGLFLEQFVGYNYFSNDGFINFYIGLNIAAGFTEGRRDYLFDVMRPDAGSRLDLLMGIRGGVYIPIFKRKSEEYYFQ